MIRRRILAAILLFGFAIGSSLFWAGGNFNPVSMGTNCILAALGLFVLHLRWRRAERNIVTAKSGRETFS